MTFIRCCANARGEWGSSRIFHIRETTSDPSDAFALFFPEDGEHVYEQFEPVTYFVSRDER